MRALEEVALSYDQKAEQASKTEQLQVQLEEAQLRSEKLSNVFILHMLLFIIKILTSFEVVRRSRTFRYYRKRLQTTAEDSKIAKFIFKYFRWVESIYIFRSSKHGVTT